MFNFNICNDVFSAWVIKEIVKDDIVLPVGTNVTAGYFYDRFALKYCLVIHEYNSDIRLRLELSDKNHIMELPRDMYSGFYEFNNGRHFLHHTKHYACIGEPKAKTIKDTRSEDYKSRSPAIPKGSTVTIKSILNNFYGEFLLVSYEGNNYYVKSTDLDYLGRSFEIKEEEKDMFDIKSTIEEINYLVPNSNISDSVYYNVTSTCMYLTYTKEYPANKYNGLTAIEENEKALENILMSMAKNDIRM